MDKCNEPILYRNIMSQLSKPIDWVKISKCLGLLMNTIVMKSDLKKEINILDEKWYDNKDWFDECNILY